MSQLSLDFLKEETIIDVSFLDFFKSLVPLEYLDFLSILKKSAKLNEFGKSFLAEFGSRYFSHPSSIPFSPSLSHYLSLDESVNYACFDPDSKEELFVGSKDAMVPKLFDKFFETIVSVHKKSGIPRDMPTLKKVGLADRYDFSRAFENFQDSHIAINMYRSYCETLLSFIRQSSSSYESISNKLAENKDGIVFSTNVLCAHSSKQLFVVDKNFPFWKLDNPQMHLVNYFDFFINLGYSYDDSSFMEKNKHISQRQLGKFGYELGICDDIEVTHMKDEYAILSWNTNNY